MRVAGVLLAAGEGSRFGQPKALVQLDGQTLAERGVDTLRAGGADPIYVVTGAANRDSAVFKDPDTFDITRNPNYHLAFGIGEHFCLGASLARLELQMIFREIAARMDHVELIGPIARMRSSFVGGIKHMPIRYKLRAKAV